MKTPRSTLYCNAYIGMFAAILTFTLNTFALPAMADWMNAIDGIVLQLKYTL